MKKLYDLPGPRSKEIFDAEQKVVSPGLQGIALYSQIALKAGKNAHVVDEDGNRYIDFVSGIGVGSIGHCHPHYVKVMRSQAGLITYSSFTTKVRKNFLRPMWCRGLFLMHATRRQLLRMYSMRAMSLIVFLLMRLLQLPSGMKQKNERQM